METHFLEHGEESTSFWRRIRAGLLGAAAVAIVAGLSVAWILGPTWDRFWIRVQLGLNGTLVHYRARPLADLRGMRLGSKDLRGAVFAGARLGGADLEGAELEGAELRNVRLLSAKGVPWRSLLEARDWDVAIYGPEEIRAIHDLVHALDLPPPPHFDDWETFFESQRSRWTGAEGTAVPSSARAGGSRVGEREVRAGPR